MALPTGQTAAGSLNRYLYGRTGAVARLRAGNTTEEEDFQLVGGALVTNDVNQDSVTDWVAAQSGNNGEAFVVTPYDHSGNNNHPTQANTVSQPRFKEDGVGAFKNYWEFDGAGDHFLLGDLLSLGGYTMSAVMQVTNASQSLGMLFGSSAILRWYHGIGQTSGEYFTRNAAAAYSSGGTVDTDRHILIFRGDGSVGNLWVDDTLVLSNSYSDSGTPTAQAMGSAQNFSFGGKVWEFTTFSSALSPTDRALLYADQNAFYNGGSPAGGFYSQSIYDRFLMGN